MCVCGCVCVCECVCVRACQLSDNDFFFSGSLYVTFPARAPRNISPEQHPELAVLGIDPGEGRSAGTQAGFQLALLVSTLAISIIGGLITGM